MSPTAEKIAADFRTLSPDDAAELVDRLVSTLHQAGTGEPVDSELQNEVRRRVDAYESGQTPAVPANEFFSRIESKRL